MTEENIKNELLYNSLVNLGNVYALDILFKFQDHELLEAFPDRWKLYNPRKNHNPRYGLSLTSLDGGMSGVPDLDSLLEYNQTHNTNLTESSFTQHTEALKKLTQISEPMKPFLPYLGRSHLIRFGEGGYFPFHRDSQSFGTNTFRLISPLLGCGPSDFCFIFDQQKINLEQQRLYFMNTKIEHALFSSYPNALIVVFNVIVSEDSVKAVISNLLAR